MMISRQRKMSNLLIAAVVVIFSVAAPAMTIQRRTETPDSVGTMHEQWQGWSERCVSVWPSVNWSRNDGLACVDAGEQHLFRCSARMADDADRISACCREADE